MATGAPGTNGVWQYGEDDSEATFSALLNKAAGTTNTQIGLDRARLTALEATGRIVQVKSATKTDGFATSSTSFTDVTGLSVSITPKSASNKILVILNTTLSSPTASTTQVYAIVRNSTQIGVGTGGGVSNATYSTDYSSIGSQNGMMPVSANFLDSPATTSATTYKLQVLVNSGSLTVNRRALDTYMSGISTITVMEVVA